VDIFEAILPVLLLRGEDGDQADARRLWASFAATHSLDEQYELIERLVVEAANFGYDSA
jgi:hypothetical protein